MEEKREEKRRRKWRRMKGEKRVLLLGNAASVSTQACEQITPWQKKIILSSVYQVSQSRSGNLAGAAGKKRKKKKKKKN